MKILSKILCCQETKVFIGKNALENAASEIPEKAKVFLIRQDVLDPTPIRSAFKNIVAEFVLKGGEESKDIEIVLKIAEKMHSVGIQRSDYVVAFGGGTLLDVAGFVSSIYLRGVNLVNIPTTLLSMVDAAIGGKNAVNFRGIKNVLGTFYQPSIIIADTLFLNTLPQAEFVNGLAEVIKYAFTLDYELYNFLKRNFENVLSRDEEALEYLIERSILNKLSVVEKDVFDVKDVRIVLNFGHTVGHMIESLSNFSVSHGKAVAVGMVYELMISTEMGITKDYVLKEAIEMIKVYGLPTSIRELNVDIPKNLETLKAVISKDKKAGWRGLTLPVVVDIGVWKPLTVNIDSYVEALANALNRC
ncbi:3-dehydroquinate synthase [Ignisphaera sp. 4213-co]|uniref:3-dehydroquinate synthase n=1 Tax=Ignisphaera cupida TaxID=3050454 RepID=A0ABD4Z577_9CREN|nr:3-dehydroquinate synthase [Ignisphaera sp. 4213-co]MDK6028093.1 3-dehydroquinate synthase [Ignisphaera sp. 4213-co]